jgi:hypothetical protein
MGESFCSPSDANARIWVDCVPPRGKQHVCSLGSDFPVSDYAMIRMRPTARCLGEVLEQESLCPRRVRGGAGSSVPPGRLLSGP